MSPGAQAEDFAKSLARFPRPAGSAGERRAHTRVRRRFEQAGLEVEVQPFHTGKGASRNVIGIKEGSRDCLRIVMGHIDTAGPGVTGADDNASGAATVTSLAPALAAATPRCTTWLVATGSEERIYTGSPDHLGAKALVKRAKQGPPLQFALAVDEVGVGGRFGVRSSAGVRGDVEGRLLRAARREDVPVRYTRDSSAADSKSDHREFELAGLPAMKLDDRYNPVRHTPADRTGRLDRLSFDRGMRLLLRLLEIQ